MRLQKIGLFLLCFFIGMSCAYSATLSFPQFKGKWVVLNYWADWCSSCYEDMPEINRLYQHTRHSNNIVVFGINYDELSGSELTQAVSKMRITFPMLKKDPEQDFGLDAIYALPTTIIINPKGEVVKKIVGATTEKALMSNIILKK